MRNASDYLGNDLNDLQGFIDVVTSKEMITPLYTDIDRFTYLSEKEIFIKYFNAEFNSFIMDSYHNRTRSYINY